MKQDQNNNSSKTEKSSKRSANSGEGSRLLSPSVSDNTSGDVELVVTGDGPTKEKATLSALRSALEQVYGTMVSSNTKILNDELVKDEIVSISTGIVKKYTYLSEKELGGRFYVVVKALVTPQKLITYAKQKGASTELAGATFAANVRIQKLNEENKRIAIRNITEMQLKLLANSFDCVITDMKEPKGRSDYERKFGFGSEVYAVRFNICLKFNDNAKHIQELQHKKEAIGGIGGYRYIYDKVLNILFDRIMVYDDIGTYNLKIVENKKGYYSKQGGRFYADGGLYVTRESSLARPALQYGGGGYLGEFMVPYENTMTKFTVYNYMFVYEGSSGYIIRDRDNGEELHEYERKVNWHLVKPNEIFVEIPVEMIYDLSDLEKITGIHVALKDLSEESTSHNPSKKVNLPQRLKGIVSVNTWNYLLGESEEGFLDYLRGNKSLLIRAGFAVDEVDKAQKAIKEEWYKAKGMK